MLTSIVFDIRKSNLSMFHIAIMLYFVTLVVANGSGKSVPNATNQEVTPSVSIISSVVCYMDYFTNVFTNLSIFLIYV